MAIIVNSRALYDILEGRSNEFPDGLDADQTHQAYNALDSAVTLRVHQALAPRLAASPHATLSYRFVRAMQAPALAMMRRGIAVNQKVRYDETIRYTAIRDHCQSLLDRLADAIWGPEVYTVTTRTREAYTVPLKNGKESAVRWRTLATTESLTRTRGLNANSTKQLLAFFNIALGLPVEYEIRKRPTGNERTPSCNDKALRRWAEMRMKGPGINVRDKSVPPVKFAKPFVSLILAIRDADKMLSVLRTPLDHDNRMRCSYNVVGTENGRWSSSENAFGRGTNLQNITPSMRRMFCSDEGYTLVSTDLEQAESRLVAGLVWQATGDRTYWAACESSDLHTTVCRMTWPELDWNDAQEKHNRAIADQPYPGLPRFSYRDVAKRLGHGSNYRGSYFGISQAVGVPPDLVKEFQHRYFVAFPYLTLWHNSIVETIRLHQFLDTPLGRRRWFFGRPTEDSTIREAIAYGPQSTIGELLNLALLNCWTRSVLPPTHPSHLPIELLLQNHDAFLFQTRAPARDLPALLAAVKHELEIPIPLVRGDQVEYLTIPGEFVTGWNWAYQDKGSDRTKWMFTDGNPDGLRKWGGAELRTRTQRAHASPADWLSRPVHGVHA